MSMIDLVGLTKVYNDKNIALNNVFISIEKGSFFSILGKNGAGKSTTIGILMSLIKKTSGKVYVSGYDLDIDLMKIKSLFGFVPQEYNFNQFETVLNVVLNQAGFYGVNRALAYKKADCLLDFFGLWDKRMSVSMSLSGGMKRRLMIVRALMHDPEILILDEPTAGVDILSRRLIWNFLKDLNNKGKTIILTTHYLEEVENLCDSVAIIDNGNVLLQTSVKDMLQKITKQIFLFEVSNNSFETNVIFDDFSLIVKNDKLLEVSLSEGKSLNSVLEFLMGKKIIINNIKNKYNKLEELFIDLIS